MTEAIITFPRSAVGVSQRSNLRVVRDRECFLYFWSNQRLRVSKSGGNGSTKIRYGWSIRLILLFIPGEFCSRCWSRDIIRVVAARRLLVPCLGWAPRNAINDILRIFNGAMNVL